jgi:hypothetical protein
MIFGLERFDLVSGRDLALGSAAEPTGNRKEVIADMPIGQVLAADLVALILLLALIRWLAGAPRRTLGDAASVERIIASAFPGSKPIEPVVDLDGQAAIAFESCSEDGFLVFLHGAKPVVWRMPAERLRPPSAHYDQAGSLVIETGDPTRQHLALRLPMAA